MATTRQETTRSQTLIVFTNGHEYTVRHRLPLLRHLQALGWNVVGVAPGQSAALATFKDLGFPVAAVSLSRAGLNPISELRAVISVLRCYKRINPTLVIHATIKPVLYGTIVSQWMGVPVVNLITGLGFAFTGSSARARISRVVISVLYRVVFMYRTQRVILQNRDDRAELISGSGLSPEHSVVVPGSGVDLVRFSPRLPSENLDSENPLVILPGRMLYDKGVAEFVEAATLLIPRFPSARFALVGPADAHNPSGVPHSVLQDWKDNNGIEWWGSIPDMREAYGKAAIVALPSRREGMPKVVLEAAACGLPVVTTRVPGCRDSVIDGVTGFLVPFGDGPALAEGIGKLLSSGGLRQKLGRNARSLAEERFAASKIVESITDAAMEIL
jgi:glycosyltransferase involved in cell wall biosynthesis